MVHMLVSALCSSSLSMLLLLADDLELNVSRETLQSNKFLKQIQGVIQKRIIQLFERLAKENPEKFASIQKIYGSVIKLGAIEDRKNRDKLTAMARFVTNQRESVSLDEVGSFTHYLYTAYI